MTNMSFGIELKSEYVGSVFIKIIVISLAWCLPILVLRFTSQLIKSAPSTQWSMLHFVTIWMFVSPEIHAVYVIVLAKC